MFFSAAHRSFSKIGCILGHKACLNYSKELRERWKGKENDRASVIL
jgi:hypothetical protein